jgi:hypothetical protein
MTSFWTTIGARVQTTAMPAVLQTPATLALEPLSTSERPKK